MYQLTKSLLESQGFEHYEVSNFARPGHQCLHNCSYWNDEAYLGLGAGAHSHFKGSRFANCRDPLEYVSRVEAKGKALAEHEVLSAQEKAREALALGLRNISGVSLQKVLKRYLVSLAPSFYAQVDKLKSLGLLSLKNDRLCLTQEGLLLADEVAFGIL